MSALELPPAPESVGDARSFCRQQLEAIGQEDLLEVASLLVSELVTNVVLHARTVCHVEMKRVGDRLRISVADRDPGSLIRKGLDAQAGSGRGLLLVEAMSLDFGEEYTEDGKVVWCDLAWAG